MRRMRSCVVDDQDALAQVLHDVLRELREVRQVDFLPAHQRFALAQAVRDGPHEQRDAEQHHAEHARVGVVRARGVSREVHEDLLDEHARARDGGDQKRVAVVAEHRHGADRQHQQDAEPARDAAAGIENERDRRRHRQPR